jgi:uncharacterized protein YqhQ
LPFQTATRLAVVLPSAVATLFALKLVTLLPVFTGKLATAGIARAKIMHITSAIAKILFFILKKSP